MFAVPRQKKSTLPPLRKKRKANPSVEEISFDPAARQEYLTGFHKRKQARIKQAQEESARKAKQEKLAARKHIRDERRREAEEHVQNVNKILVASTLAGNIKEEEEQEEEEESKELDSWDGLDDQTDFTTIGQEEEFVDEDRYTTVTVNSVSISRDGFEMPASRDGDEVEVASTKAGDDLHNLKAEAQRSQRKKKKFRYESRFERQLEKNKQRMKRTNRK